MAPTPSRLLVAAVLLTVLSASGAGAALRWPMWPGRQQPLAPTPQRCSALVEGYLAAHSGDLDLPPSAQDPSKMLFFLHVPRTAGKCYFTCFLKSAMPPSQRCAKAYDWLRYNVSQPGCRLLTSHDDFSITDLFPPSSATITQLRDPVKRVVSAYEFAIDTAARRVNVRDEPRATSRRRFETIGVSTLDVWPWSYLVPWFKDDMRARMAKLREAAKDDPSRVEWRPFRTRDGKNRTFFHNKKTNESVWKLPEPRVVLDPYNNELVTPLHEWIETPIARELIHDGATFQVLGITNYSYWDDHEELRSCVWGDPAARQSMLDATMRRLRAMKHVGITEQLDDSVLSMAADLGYTLAGPSFAYTPATAFSYDAPDLDAEAANMTFYNSTASANQTVSLQEGRQRLVWANARMRTLADQLEVLVPKLRELVDTEEKWLEEQDKLKEEAEREEKEAAAAAGAVWEEEEEGPAPDAPEEAVEDAAAGSPKHLSRNATLKASLKPPPKKKRNQKPPVAGAPAADAAADAPDGGNATLAGGAAATNATQAEEAAGEGGAGGEGEEEPRIDSPWATEIEELDDTVHGLQTESKALGEEVAALEAGGVVFTSATAQGPARQILPDDHFLQKEVLGESYIKCQKGGKSNSQAKKKKTFPHLRTPWHESFAFGSDARATIDAGTLARIRELNALDTEIWELGKGLLGAKLEEHWREGALESFEPYVGKHSRPKGAGAGSAGDEVQDPDLPRVEEEDDASSAATEPDGGEAAAEEQQQQQEEERGAEEQGGGAGDEASAHDEL